LLDTSASYQLVVAFAAVVFTVTVHCTGTLAKATDVSTTGTVTSTLVSLAVAGYYHELPSADCCFLLFAVMVAEETACFAGWLQSHRCF